MGDASTRLLSYFLVIGVPDTDVSEEPMAVIVDRFPLSDYPDFSLSPAVQLFCFPKGLTVLDEEDPNAFTLLFSRPQVHSFALTEGDGSRRYACCLTFFEPRPSHPGQLVQKVICVLSHWPLYSAFEAFLGFIYQHFVHGTQAGVVKLPRVADSDSAPAVSLEQILCSFLPHVHMPRQGERLVFEVGPYTWTLNRPVSALPVVDSACFEQLFACLDCDSIVTLVSCLLMEQRVIVHSEHMDRIAQVTSALLSLLFPLYWTHVYIPMLPLQLLEYLEAPVPFIMGMHTDCLGTRIAVDVLPSAVIVHLDFNKIVTPMDIELAGGTRADSVPEFPEPIRSRLLGELHMHAPSVQPGGRPPMMMADEQSSQWVLPVRCAFLDAMAACLVHYRRYISLKSKQSLAARFTSQYLRSPKPSGANTPMSPMSPSNDTTVQFDNEGFVKQAPAHWKRFLMPLSRTQAFITFIEDAGRISAVVEDDSMTTPQMEDLLRSIIIPSGGTEQDIDAAEIRLFDYAVHLRAKANRVTVIRRPGTGPASSIPVTMSNTVNELSGLLSPAQLCDENRINLLQRAWDFSCKRKSVQRAFAVSYTSELIRNATASAAKICHRKRRRSSGSTADLSEAGYSLDMCVGTLALLEERTLREFGDEDSESDSDDSGSRSDDSTVEIQFNTEFDSLPLPPAAASTPAPASQMTAGAPATAVPSSPPVPPPRKYRVSITGGTATGVIAAAGEHAAAEEDAATTAPAPAHAPPPMPEPLTLEPSISSSSAAGNSGGAQSRRARRASALAIQALPSVKQTARGRSDSVLMQSSLERLFEEPAADGAADTGRSRPTLRSRALLVREATIDMAIKETSDDEDEEKADSDESEQELESAPPIVARTNSNASASRSEAHAAATRDAEEEVLVRNLDTGKVEKASDLNAEAASPSVVARAVSETLNSWRNFSIRSFTSSTPSPAGPASPTPAAASAPAAAHHAGGASPAIAAPAPAAASCEEHPSAPAATAAATATATAPAVPSADHPQSPSVVHRSPALQPSAAPADPVPPVPTSPQPVPPTNPYASPPPPEAVLLDTLKAKWTSMFN